jgi:hypothetical protein
MYTNAELITKAMDGIIAQGKQSVNTFGQCVYRSPDGSKCAAGHLIKDEHYNPQWNSLSPYQTMVRDALKLSGVTEEQMPIVRALQQVHDEGTDEELRSKWPEHKRRLLKTFGGLNANS